MILKRVITVIGILFFLSCGNEFNDNPISSSEKKNDDHDNVVNAQPITNVEIEYNNMVLSWSADKDLSGWLGPYQDTSPDPILVDGSWTSSGLSTTYIGELYHSYSTFLFPAPSDYGSFFIRITDFSEDSRYNRNGGNPYVKDIGSRIISNLFGNRSSDDLHQVYAAEVYQLKAFTAKLYRWPPDDGHFWLPRHYPYNPDFNVEYVFYHVMSESVNFNSVLGTQTKIIDLKEESFAYFLDSVHDGVSSAVMSTEPGVLNYPQIHGNIIVSSLDQNYYATLNNVSYNYNTAVISVTYTVQQGAQ